MAMIAAEVGARVRILGTDVNTDFLERAREGVFSSWSLRRLSPERQSRFLREVGKERWEVREGRFPEVEFRHHNLLMPPPRSGGPEGRWEVILCRNVLIYFSAQARGQALNHLFEGLGEEGWLILGSSEVVEGGEAGGRLRSRQRNGGFLYRREAPDEKGGSHGKGRDEEESRGSVGLAEITSEAGEEEMADALMARAQVHLRKGEEELAMACLEALLGYDPFQVECHCVIGALLGARGAEREAQMAFQKALFLDPHHWYGAHRLAMLHEQHGEVGAARLGYRQVLRSLGRGEDSLKDQAYLRELIGNVEEVRHQASRKAEDFLQLHGLYAEE